MNSSTNQPVSNAPQDSGAKDSAVPIWLIIVCFMLLYWGAVYFDEHGGWFDAQVYTPYVSGEQLNTFAAMQGPPDIREQGRKIYDRTCTTCHGPAGAGQPGNFPPLAGSDWVNEKDPGRMIRLVLQGLSGPGLKVNGQPFNTGSAMVPWNSLSDEDIAAVISYVRGNAEWGNKASVVTPEQVKAIRDKVKAHQMSFTPAELEAINPAE